jgi:hypothetical protein
MLTDFDALPAFCTMGTEFISMGKVAGAGTDHSLPLYQVENGLVLYFHILPSPLCQHRNIIV